MLRWVIVLVIFCMGAAPPVSATPPKPWPLMRYVRWQPAWGARTIHVAGVSVRVELKHCGIDRPADEACSNGEPYPVATVGEVGRATLTVRGDPSAAAYVGLGRLTSTATSPSFIMISADGGSAGCVQIDIAVPDRAAFRHVRLSVDPDDHGTICEVDPATLPWPADLTRHRRAEFLFMNRLYGGQSVSHAGEWRAPRVVAFDGRRTVDVSGDPALDRLYRQDMAKARTACERRREPEAPCTAYAADAARFGSLPQALALIDRQIRRGCRVPANGVCSDGESVPSGLKAELAARFQR